MEADTHILIEDTALGPALGGHLNRFGHNVVQVGIRGKSKEERFQNNLDRFKAHHVVLCEGPWLPCFLDEMVRFPFGEDDQVDALTQLLSWIRENPSPPARQLVTNPSCDSLVRERNPQRDPVKRLNLR